MKIDTINKGMSKCQNIEAGDSGKAGSLNGRNQQCKAENSSEVKLRAVAQQHDFTRPVSFDESKKIAEIMQEENDILSHLTIHQREEINTMIAEFLMKDPILYSKLLTILRGLKE